MPDPQQGAQPTQLPLSIQAQYLKDLSFENPMAPNHFTELQQAGQSGGPNVNIEVSTNARQLGENVYEVSLTVHGDAKVGEKALFVVEATFAGIFTLHEVAEPNVKPLLLIEGPRHLFPFARNVVADATREGGFPPLLINPIDFADLYRRQQASEAAGAQPNVYGGPPAQGSA
jgi:preprotein translocase subunit SecB